MKELWTGEETKTRDGQFVINNLAPHDCRLYRCRLVKK
jgi:hypothetical protein